MFSVERYGGDGDVAGAAAALREAKLAKLHEKVRQRQQQVSKKKEETEIADSAVVVEDAVDTGAIEVHVERPTAVSKRSKKQKASGDVLGPEDETPAARRRKDKARAAGVEGEEVAGEVDVAPKRGKRRIAVDEEEEGGEKRVKGGEAAKEPDAALPLVCAGWERHRGE